VTWFKVCDTANLHPKIVAASGEAIKMWVRAGSWAAQQLTDGFVPDHYVPVFGTHDLAAELVTVRLWSRDDERDGYQFHDWDHYQPSKAQIERRRENDRFRQSVRRSVSHGVTPGVTHNVSGGGVERASSTTPLPSPSQRDTGRESRRDTGPCPHDEPRGAGGCAICRFEARSAS
jgi:hypothetical protein